TTNPLKADLNPLFANDTERTFNLDLRNNGTGATGADGVIDSSGSYFINLSSLRTSRDNMRQGISDLMVLRQSLPSMKSASPIALNTKKVGFVGISLGSIVGTGYLSQEATSTPATLAVPGGGIARLLDGSETFGPPIQQGLAASGIVKGTAAYDTFMGVAQWVIDPADPIVLGKKAADKHPIHMMEVVGVNGVGSDKVIPNRVAGAPLSGTEPLISIMGLKSISQTGTPDGVVRFTEGAHGSLLDPSTSLAATTEMQAETAVFQAKLGTAIPVFNPAVVKQ
ncbi:MAG TPA: lipase, partial [Thiolinea sp.]|nr:lipase [Thiolinea sp.]